MSAFDIIVLIVGFILLLLGIFSGLSLFRQASKGSIDIDDNSSMLSIWGLFLTGICVGLLFIWVALP